MTLFAPGAELDLTILHRGDPSASVSEAGLPPRHSAHKVGKSKDTALLPRRRGQVRAARQLLPKYPAGSCTNHPAVRTSHTTAECRMKKQG